MKIKIVFVLMGWLCFFFQDALTWKILPENYNSEATSVDGVPDDEFYQDLPTGPEKLAEVRNNDLEEGKLSEVVVDEETVRKAEKTADKDLLSGLNRILKNNETLKDVFKTENVYEIP